MFIFQQLNRDMTERIYYLEGVDPLQLYGINNMHFTLMQKFFPQLRLTGRGSELKITGPEIVIDQFIIRLESIISNIQRYNTISIEDVENIMMDGQLLGEKEDADTIIFGNNGKAIKALTPNQRELIDSFAANDLIFATGQAGTGKTYTAIALAVKLLKSKTIKRIILTRPAVEAGERLGFLPGDMKDKLDPYLQPLFDALRDMLPPKKLFTYMEDETIQIAPLAYMRGRTLDHAVVILDEAQNASLSQLKMFLTRMGKNAKFVVTGDITQIDLPVKSSSGLSSAMKMLKGIEGVTIIEFDHRDNMRHPLVKKIVEKKRAYKNIEDKTNKNESGN